MWRLSIKTLLKTITNEMISYDIGINAESLIAEIGCDNMNIKLHRIIVLTLSIITLVSIGTAYTPPGLYEDWVMSEHGSSYDNGMGANTYCAKCKSPIEFDPQSTLENNIIIPESKWQSVTCLVCHTTNLVPQPRPPGAHLHLMGNYIPGSGDPNNATLENITQMYIIRDNPNDLCAYCHTGRYEVTFVPGYGRIMEKKGVTCLDCHMPMKPNPVPIPQLTEFRSHKLDPLKDSSFSCGINRDDCHYNKNEDWALKQMLKEKIHPESD